MEAREIKEQIQGQARENDLRLEVKKSLRRQIYNAIRKMDVLQDLLEDEDITEIMVNGPSQYFCGEGWKAPEDGQKI